SGQTACSRCHSSRTPRRSFPARGGPCWRPAGGRANALLVQQRQGAASDARRVPDGAAVTTDLAEFFISEGISPTTEDEAYLVWADYAIWPEDYDEPVDARYRQDYFDLEGSPCAKAYLLLDGLDLGPLRLAYHGQPGSLASDGLHIGITG